MFLERILCEVVVAQIEFSDATFFLKVAKFPFRNLIVLQLKIVEVLDRTKYSHRNFENAVMAQVQVRNIFEIFETARL